MSVVLDESEFEHMMDHARALREWGEAWKEWALKLEEIPALQLKTVPGKRPPFDPPGGGDGIT